MSYTNPINQSTGKADAIDAIDETSAYMALIRMVIGRCMRKSMKPSAMWSA